MPSRLDRTTSASPSPTGGAFTLKDVARLAGVSVGTVSMALADHPRISEPTKERVRQAAARLGYVPNSLGRGLRAKRLGAVALVVPATSREVFTHPYFMEALEGITEVLNARDMTLVVSTARSEDGDSAYLKLLRSRRADGVIVAAAPMVDANIDRLAMSGYPVVVLGRYPHDPSVCAVGVDDRGGAESAINHLLGVHKARRPAHISGPHGHIQAADRLEGYRAALGRHGIAYDERLVVEGDGSSEAGDVAATALLDAGIPFDSLFVWNDEMAIGALGALKRAARKVPDEIALVSFDDIRFAAVTNPPLTTVRQPMRDSACLGAERLLAMLDGESVEPRQVLLETRLVVRTSCGC